MNKKAVAVAACRLKVVVSLKPFFSGQYSPVISGLFLFPHFLLSFNNKTTQFLPFFQDCTELPSGMCFSLTLIYKQINLAYILQLSCKLLLQTTKAV